MGTKHSKCRAMIINDFYAFVNQNKYDFFKASKQKEFVLQHPYVRKATVVQHLEMGMRQLCDMRENVFDQAMSGTLSLTKRLDFKEFQLEKKSSTIANSTSANIKVFTVDQFIKLVHLHDNANCTDLNASHMCRAMVQSVMGFRLDETILEPDSFKIIYSDHQNTHNKYQLCKNPNPNCCHTITLTTKTGVQKKCVPPQILKCIEYLIKIHKNKQIKKASLNKYYNDFLRDNFEVRSQHMRKLLPNHTTANSSFRNTGSWKSMNIMNNHYLTEATKQFDVLKSLDRFFGLRNICAPCTDFKNFHINHIC